MNDETNTDINLDASKVDQDYLDSNNSNLNENLLNSQENEIEESEICLNVPLSKPQESEEIKNQVKFVADESNERLDLIDNLPEFSASVNDRKFIKQTSSSSEPQTSFTSSYLNTPTVYPSYYELKIKLINGKNLAIRDFGGSSDPYAKFVINGINVYKSKIIFKNLNPEWDEEFTIKLTPALFYSKTKRSNSIQSAPQNFENSLIDEPLESFLSKFKLKMFIYDYDRGFLSDDLIGYSFIDLTFLKENM